MPFPLYKLIFSKIYFIRLITEIKKKTFMFPSIYTIWSYARKRLFVTGFNCIASAVIAEKINMNLCMNLRCDGITHLFLNRTQSERILTFETETFQNRMLMNRTNRLILQTSRFTLNIITNANWMDGVVRVFRCTAFASKISRWEITEVHVTFHNFLKTHTTEWLFSAEKSPNVFAAERTQLLKN